MHGSMCPLDLVLLGLLHGEIANLLLFFLPSQVMEKQIILILLLFFLGRGSVSLFVLVVGSSDSGAWSADSEAWSVDAVR